MLRPDRPARRLRPDACRPWATWRSTRTTRSRTPRSRSARRSTEALGDKAGINRYGDAVVPMDEVLVQAAVDLSGRPYVVHDEPPLAPYVGPVYPTSMTRHVWESLGQSARMTLHVNVLRACRPGGNPDAHHVIEAQFKAVARALRRRCEQDPAARRACRAPRGSCDRYPWSCCSSSAASCSAAPGRSTSRRCRRRS